MKKENYTRSHKLRRRIERSYALKCHRLRHFLQKMCNIDLSSSRRSDSSSRIIGNVRCSRRTSISNSVWVRRYSISSSTIRIDVDLRIKSLTSSSASKRKWWRTTRIDVYGARERSHIVEKRRYIDVDKDAKKTEKSEFYSRYISLRYGRRIRLEISSIG